MIIKTLEGWELPKHTVRYTQKGKEIEQAVGLEGKQWWIDFAAKWEHTDIIEFTDLVYAEEQLLRLQEVQNLEEQHMEAAEDYVLNGVMADIEPFRAKKLQNELAATQEAVDFLIMGGM